MNMTMSRRNSSETGIYVVCSDKALLDRINSMLRLRGVIGIADAEGKMHYFVDGRKNGSRTVSEVRDMVVRNAADLEFDAPENQIARVVRSTMQFYDFDLSLIGSSAIFETVKRMVRYRDVYYHSVRELLTFAGENMKLSYDQTERNIRYAIKKSGFDGMGMKTTMVLRVLADEVTEKLSDMKRQPA